MSEYPPTGRDLLTNDNIERFWSFVTKGGDDECWGWTGGFEKGPTFRSSSGQIIWAGRFAGLLDRNGHLPSSVKVCKLCSDTRCMNPKHFAYFKNQNDPRLSRLRLNFLNHGWISSTSGRIFVNPTDLLQRDRYGIYEEEKEALLSCPSCGEHNLHPYRGGECPDPNNYYPAFEVRFWCEHCDSESVLTFGNYKGDGWATIELVHHRMFRCTTHNSGNYHDDQITEPCVNAGDGNDCTWELL